MQVLAIPLSLLAIGILYGLVIHGWPKITIKKTCKKGCNCQK